jgi:hypothetical protein
MTTGDVVVIIICASIVLIWVCGCAGGGYSSYEPVLQTSSYDHASEPLPPSQPQTVWVRTLGQPDQLVTVIPEY